MAMMLKISKRQEIYPNEPSDEFQEWRNDGSILNLFDHQHRERGLVPCESLSRRVLNRTNKYKDESTAEWMQT